MTVVWRNYPGTQYLLFRLNNRRRCLEINLVHDPVHRGVFHVFKRGLPFNKMTVFVSASSVARFYQKCFVIKPGMFHCQKGDQRLVEGFDHWVHLGEVSTRSAVITWPLNQLKRSDLECHRSTTRWDTKENLSRSCVQWSVLSCLQGFQNHSVFNFSANTRDV